MNSIFKKAVQLLVAPREAIIAAETDQGLTKSLWFVVVMSLLSAVLLSVVMIFSEGLPASLSDLIINLIALPVSSILMWLGFGTVIFIIWKIVGSEQSYFLSLRIVASFYALLPLWVLAQQIGSVAQIAIVAWLAILLLLASEQIHRIARWKAVLVIGVLVAITIKKILCHCGDTGAEAVAPTLAPLSPVVTENNLQGTNGELDEEPKDVLINSENAEMLASTQVEEVKPTQEKDERFAVSPEELGYRLGDMVRELEDSVSSVGDDFLRGLEAGKGSSESSSQPIEQSVRQNQPEQKEESSDDLPSLSPSQLGEVLGRFIREIDQAANEIEKGYNEAIDGQDAEQSSSVNQAAEQAGKSLGEFVRAFNEAVNKMDNQDEAAAQ
jgi:hypothetical protein